MRIRLFWKILFSFWLTFICIIKGVWIVFTLYDVPRKEPRVIQVVEALAESRLDGASLAVRLGGEGRLDAFLASWPEEDRLRLTREPASGNSSEAASAGVSKYPDYFRSVVLPDGGSIVLRYNASDVLPGRDRPGPPNIPPELLILGILGGLLFSALLAWYLTAPMWRLRAGFDALAMGNLGVRLRPLMGRRRDEITDLARDFDMMAERMQSLLESREQLLHDVSHELRSPLARLHMAVGLARQNPQRTGPLLDRIEGESARMDNLVGELLTLSRVEFGAETLEEYFDLQSLARVVVDNVRFEARENGVGIELETLPRDDISTVRGDAELVRRALENVIRNAMRHSPRGTSVEVKVFAGDDRDTCCIQVTDSGPGVPGDSLERIFEPFVRLKNTSSHGAGLGLAIARRAILVHSGSIRADNCDEGGLRITIVLPLASFEMAGSDAGHER